MARTTKKRISANQRWKYPISVLVDGELRKAVEVAARKDDRSLSSWFRLLAVKETEAKGFYDSDSDKALGAAAAVKESDDAGEEESST